MEVDVPNTPSREFCPAISCHLTLVYTELPVTCKRAVMFSAQIPRQTVDRFRARPSDLPPYCQLNASLCAGTEVGSILEERVGLKGAKEPFNFFLLECDPTTAGVLNALVCQILCCVIKDSPSLYAPV